MSRLRPRTDWTVHVYRVGSSAAAVLLACGFVVNLLGQAEIGRVVAMAGIIGLLATPVAALATTFLELRTVHRRAALLALVVLATLTLATALASLNS
jgi:hypothetical protein